MCLRVCVCVRLPLLLLLLLLAHKHLSTHLAASSAATWAFQNAIDMWNTRIHTLAHTYSRTHTHLHTNSVALAASQIINNNLWRKLCRRHSNYKWKHKLDVKQGAVPQCVKAGACHGGEGGGGAGHTDCVEGRPYKIMHKRTLGRLQVGNAQSRRNYKAHKAQRGSSEGRSKR